MRWLLLVFVVAACGGSNSSSSTGGSPQALVVQAVGTQSSAIAAPGGTLQLAAYESVAGSYGGSTLQQVMASWSSSATAVSRGSGRRARPPRADLLRGFANEQSDHRFG